jgi:hypothetical protein
MLEPPTADTRHMLHSALRTVSLACCALLVASFVLFGHDQVAGASQHQQNAITSVNAPSAKPSTGKHAQPRRFIDGAAGELTSPFRSIVKSGNSWVDHGVPAVIGLVVYGLGLGYLARFTQGRA